MATSGKIRKCPDSSLDYLLIEIVRRYSSQSPESRSAAILDGIGFRVGRQLVERYTRDRARLADNLEVIRFLCKDLWAIVFGKQVDSLKTNHMGVYVLQDHHFRWFQHISVEAAGPGEGPTIDKIVEDYIHIPAGIIRGALTQLGIACTVQAGIKELPACSFTIKITP
ncbi:hypothetical protein BSKO_03480 [Bryopsis sp. KO-2023]|nr:hypothetical protein BSKO_03480 [Bryopsis sp. KO-2023]